MSRIFLESGESVPVTYLEIEPNTVVRLKTKDRDGYNAVVLGISPESWKSRKGKDHTKFALQKEWKVESLDGMKSGDKVTASVIPAASSVSISAVSKGKGFQGVMKRHHFQGGPASHGSHFHRDPGSIGMRAHPGRVLKGKRMAGRMGNCLVTLKRRPVISSDPEKGVICVKGPVPGPEGSHIFLTLEP